MKKQEKTLICGMQKIYHPYTINSECRETVTKTIATISFGCTLLCTFCDLEGWLLGKMGISNASPAVMVILQIIEAVLPLTLYGALTYLYNNYAWKMLRRWHKIPDLSGIWEGWLSSPLKDEKRSLVIWIDQRWNKIAVSTKTNTGADAWAFTAAIVTREDDIKLSYSYNNRRQGGGGEDMSYQGFNTLALKQDGGTWTLEGEYFTNKRLLDSPGKGSKGRLAVRRRE